MENQNNSFDQLDIHQLRELLLQKDDIIQTMKTKTKDYVIKLNEAHSQILDSLKATHEQVGNT